MNNNMNENNDEQNIFHDDWVVVYSKKRGKWGRYLKSSIYKMNERRSKNNWINPLSANTYLVWLEDNKIEELRNWIRFFGE